MILLQNLHLLQSPVFGDHGKLANQIARLATIVVKTCFLPRNTPERSRESYVAEVMFIAYSWLACDVIIF